MRQTLRRLLRPTIWGPGHIPSSERKYAVPLKRFALPLLDLVFLYAGWYAIKSGIPSLDILLPDVVSSIASFAFIVAAAGACIGVVFPCLWWLEIASKIALIGLLGTYYLALRTLATGDPARDFISAIVLATVVLPGFGLWILGIELRDRREKRSNP
jgi:hypothetical protein